MTEITINWKLENINPIFEEENEKRWNIRKLVEDKVEVGCNKVDLKK